MAFEKFKAYLIQDPYNFHIEDIVDVTSSAEDREGDGEKVWVEQGPSRAREYVKSIYPTDTNTQDSITKLIKLNAELREIKIKINNELRKMNGYQVQEIAS